MLKTYLKSLEHEYKTSEDGHRERPGLPLCGECNYPEWCHERTKDSAEMGICWSFKEPFIEVIKQAIETERVAGISAANGRQLPNVQT